MRAPGLRSTGGVWTLGLLVLAATPGCGGGDKKDDNKKEEPVTSGKTDKPRPISPVLTASVAGKWTRGDGLVFEVKDDGTTVAGTLESDPKAGFETYSFTLHREGDALVGKASWKEKAGLAGETGWTLHAADGGSGDLVGDCEFVTVDPDSNEITDWKQTEKQPFAVVRPAPPPAPEPVKTPEPPAPETPKAETPANPETPKTDAPANPETPKTDAPANPETPKTDTPAPETPKGDMPKAETPAADAPKGDMPKEEPK